MKPRLSFTLKILLPYMVFALLSFLVLLSELKNGHAVIVWLGVAGMVLSLFFGVLHLSWFRRPLERVGRLLSQLTRGIIPDFKASESQDEIGELERNLEQYVGNLKKIAAFSRSMANGDFSGHYVKLSNEDELGDALNRLKINLMESRQDSEARRREEENRTWSAQGLASFSSFFREAEDNLHDLSTLLMKELVAYTEADVGALFITVGEETGQDSCLEVAGSYAFDREKQLHSSFKFGEGLVGRVALEKEPIYMSDLPEDYLKIRSGLGEDVPSSILLVPVILDEQVLGVMELASLGEIPAHQIDFIRQLADALAATLAKVKVREQAAIREAELLKEMEALRSGSE